MNEKQIYTLRIRGIDIEGVMRRLSNNQTVFEACLKDFLYDTTIDDLNKAVESFSWDDAFTAAHALKGLAGNLGFYPLMHKTSQLVILIRGGRIAYLPEAINELESAYRDVIDGIHSYFNYADYNE